jgi:hypothetical protein
MPMTEMITGWASVLTASWGRRQPGLPRAWLLRRERQQGAQEGHRLLGAPYAAHNGLEQPRNQRRVAAALQEAGQGADEAGALGGRRGSQQRLQRLGQGVGAVEQQQHLHLHAHRVERGWQRLAPGPGGIERLLLCALRVQAMQRAQHVMQRMLSELGVDTSAPKGVLGSMINQLKNEARLAWNAPASAHTAAH